jgi:hypothetical protein
MEAAGSSTSMQISLQHMDTRSRSSSRGGSLGGNQPDSLLELVKLRLRGLKTRMRIIKPLVSWHKLHPRIKLLPTQIKTR